MHDFFLALTTQCVLGTYVHIRSGSDGCNRYNLGVCNMHTFDIQIFKNVVLHVNTIHDHHVTPPLKPLAVLNDKKFRSLNGWQGSAQCVQTLK